VARRVRSRNVENEEAKARYRAVKIEPRWVVTPGKQTTAYRLDLHGLEQRPMVSHGKDNTLSVAVKCREFLY
jgi:hypothetical protein